MFTGLCVDGCELDEHTELSLGDTVRRPCPCQEYLQTLLNGQETRIICSGSYRRGVQSLQTDLSQCVTVTNEVTNALCQAAMV